MSAPTATSDSTHASRDAGTASGFVVRLQDVGAAGGERAGTAGSTEAGGAPTNRGSEAPVRPGLTNLRGEVLTAIGPRARPGVGRAVTDRDPVDVVVVVDDEPVDPTRPRPRRRHPRRP